MALVELPCPECRMRHLEGTRRIGNNRNKCTTCNRFYQNVTRMACKRLRAEYPEAFARIRSVVEHDLYAQVLEDFIVTHPRSRGEVAAGG